MKTFVRTGAVVALLLAAAAPVVAQTPPPSARAGMARMGGERGMHGPGMFASMSEAGRQTMMDAMRTGGDRRAEREQVKTARDRMLTILEADRLDSSALKRAMDDERNAANASRERHQAAMLEGFGKLSPADRKAFVADARAMKTRMEARMQEWRGKHGRRGGPGGPSGPDDMPPPPTM